MKTMKKAVALILSLVMVLAMGTTAFAAGTDSEGTITITNPQAGETYSIYCIFDLELSADKNSYRYTVNEDWEDFFEEGAPGAAYVTVEDDGHVTWNKTSDANVNVFALAAKKWAAENSVEAVDSKECTTSDTEVKFEGLKLGYYLIDSSDSTLVALGTVAPDLTITQKSALPNIDKEVEEDSATDGSDNQWGYSNTADIGQTVNFKVTITAETGATGYVLHDTMSDGLDYTGVSEVTWTHKNDAGETVTDTLTVTTDYTVVTPGTETDGNKCTFEVKFDQDFLDKVVNNDEIIVYYSATVTEDAVVGGNGNKNEAKLEYGDDNDFKKDETITYTYPLNIWKYYKDGNDENPLAGAEFILYKTVKTEGDTETPLYATFAKDSTTGVYTLTDWTETKDDATTLTSGEDGFIHVEGLDADTYYLEETQAPAGYNLLDKPVTIKINENGTVEGAKNVTVGEGENATEINSIKVENNNGPELPETGGIGTTIFYIVGGLLMVGAVVLLVTKKKMSAQD